MTTVTSDSSPSPHPPRVGWAAGTLGALGVVFGDIGTSPIYTVATLFNPEDPHPVPVSEESVLGLVSLVFWSVTIIVTMLYVGLVLRADNDGEGGLLSLVALIRRAGEQRAKAAAVVSTLGVIGAALFLADSMITPAISVLSAVEGIKVVAPHLETAVIPITIGIILALFLVQRLGSAKVGRVFGPVMAAWFGAIGVLGAIALTREPTAVRALLPTEAIGYVLDHPATGFFALAAVVLSITGAEALYADLGHFGRRSITTGWLVLVYPACTLSYLGQAALILRDEAASSAPFFLIAPGWAQLPLIALATAATVIASQAVISGAFSVTQQAVRLGYLPRLRILHTSADSAGQIYVPYVNWVLMVMVVCLVLAFRSSSALAFAFGMAVTGTIVITTLLLLRLARIHWHWPPVAITLVGGPLLLIELAFLGANMTKFVHGAWLPILIAALLVTVFLTWQRGRVLVSRRRELLEGPLDAFVEEIRAAEPPVPRVPGHAIFLNRGRDTAPLALRTTVEHLRVLHRSVLIVSIETLPQPYVDTAASAVVDHLRHTDDGIVHLTLPVGYLDRTDVPALLRSLPTESFERPLDLSNASWFLSTLTFELDRQGSPDVADTTDGRPMPRWQSRLFRAATAINADPVEYFHLPRQRTIVVGSRLAL